MNFDIFISIYTSIEAYSKRNSKAVELNSNNVNTLETIFKPRIICLFDIMAADPLQPDSVPFG